LIKRGEKERLKTVIHLLSETGPRSRVMDHPFHCWV